MSDLISRSALIAYVKELPTYEPTGRGFIFKRYPNGLFAPDDIVKSIENAHAVDAVEVVRCKDCQYYSGSNLMEDGEKVCKCWVDWLPTCEDDFCSSGVRRADDGNSED